MLPALRFTPLPFLAAVAFGQGSLTQPAWNQVTPEIVSDPGRGRLTTVDDDGVTWEWDGSRWREMARGLGAARRHLVHDLNRGVTVLMQAAGSSGMTEHLEWDGHEWTPVTTVPFGPGAMVHDPFRGRIVMLDGDYLFEFDGTSWSYVFTVPPVGVSPHLVVDWSAQHVLLLSGAHQIGAPLQTSSWDGTSLQLLATNGPPASYAGVAFDFTSNRVVHHGGGALGVSTSQEWLWDGSQWTPQPTPYVRRQHRLVWDSNLGQLVAFGGLVSYTDAVRDVWRRGATGWQSMAPTSLPPARPHNAMAYDAGRDRVVLFGGHEALFQTPVAELWEFDGSVWRDFTPGTAGPPPRSDHAMAAGPNGGVLVFGGEDAAGQSLGDLWRWDGVTWTQLAALGPPARSRPGMALDAGRARVVVHGGRQGVASLGDTWEWDGTQWHGLANSGPLSNVERPMVHDPVGGGVVFVSNSANSAHAGLWRWDGQVWALIGPAAPVRPVTLAFDADVDQVVAFTNDNSGAVVANYWNGTAWIPAAAARRIPMFWFDGIAPAAVYDELRRRIVLHTGTIPRRWGGAVARAEAVGAPCADPAVRTPFVHGFGAPRIGDAAYRLDLRSEPSRTGVVGFAFSANPISLGAGCVWEVGGGAVTRFVVTDPAGNGSVPLAIPNDRSLAGLTLFAQLATLESAAARGFVLSTPLRLTLGD